jgi:hypothetical protein
MPGVWGKDGSDRWRPLTATGFVSEADLHIGVTAFHYEPSDRALRV